MIEQKYQALTEEDKHAYIEKLATFLHREQKVMSFAALAKHLNQNGFRTSYGAIYSESGRNRAIVKLIETTSENLTKAGKQIEANWVLKAFVNNAYGYAWEV